MATHDTKKLFMTQRSLEIRVADMPNLSLKSRKNIQVLSLTKTIKNSFFIEELKLLKLLKESFLLRPGLLIFLFWHFGSTAWKVSRYGVFFGLYFPKFDLNSERYWIQNTDQKKLRIWSIFSQGNKENLCILVLDCVFFSLSVWFSMIQYIREKTFH